MVAAGAKYHYMGLGGGLRASSSEEDVQKRVWSETLGPIFTLDAILDGLRLSHVSILKLDCEGW